MVQDSAFSQPYVIIDSFCPWTSGAIQVRRTPCPPKLLARWLQVRLGRLRLSPACPFRLLHTFLSLRPARHYPRLWIPRSSSERRRDLNPPDLGAAQRTLCRLLTSAPRSGHLAVPPVPTSEHSA